MTVEATPLRIHPIALEARRHGPILPLNADKKPCVKWKEFQSRFPTDEALAEWQRLYRPQAWALVTGAISRRISLDFDAGIGLTWAEQLMALGIMPHRRSGSGGLHFDFEHPGWRVKTLNSKSCKRLGERYPGMDPKGDGGYVVICGRNSKGFYELLRDWQPHPLSLLPANLREFLGLLRPPAPERPRLAPTRTSDAPRALSDVLLNRAILMTGACRGRNVSGFWLSCQLRDNGHSRTEAEAILREFARRVPDTNTKGEIEEYGEQDAIRSVQSAYGAAAREPWRPRVTRIWTPTRTAGRRGTGTNRTRRGTSTSY